MQLSRRQLGDLSPCEPIERHPGPKPVAFEKSPSFTEDDSHLFVVFVTSSIPDT